MYKPCLVVGYTTRFHLLLDLDDTTYIKTSYLIDQIFKEWPEIGDCAIMFSSKGADQEILRYDNFQRPYHKRDRLSFHLVFSNLIGYNKACKICETLAGLFIINKGYSDIRKFRGDLTLRVSPKIGRNYYKPIPELISIKQNPYNKKRGKYIGEYLQFLRIVTDLGIFDFETKTKTHDSGNRPDHR